MVVEKEEGEQRFRKRKSSWRGTPRQVVFPPTDDKVLRRGQHEYFKRHFRGVVEGDRVSLDALTRARMREAASAGDRKGRWEVMGHA